MIAFLLFHFDFDIKGGNVENDFGTKKPCNVKEADCFPKNAAFSYVLFSLGISYPLSFCDSLWSIASQVLGTPVSEQTFGNIPNRRRRRGTAAPPPLFDRHLFHLTSISFG